MPRTGAEEGNEPRRKSPGWTQVSTEVWETLAYTFVLCEMAT